MDYVEYIRNILPYCGI